MSTTTAGFIVLGLLAAPVVFGIVAWWVSRRSGANLPPGPDTVTAHKDDLLGYSQAEAIARRVQGPKL